MRPIVGPEFVHQVLNVKINCVLRNRQLIGNLLVAMTISNESENFQLPSRKIVVTHVLGETGRYLGRNVPTAGVNRPDHPQQLVHVHALQDITRGSGSHRTLDVAIAIGGCQHDDMSVSILPSNCDQSVGAIRTGETKVHQGNIGPVTTKFGNGLHRVGSMRDQKHIGLGPDDLPQSFAKDWMILYAQNANWLSLVHSEA